MAEVYEATDSRLNRRVAVKVLRGELAKDPMFLERFRREAQSAAGLNHPNIVAVYDTGEDNVDGVTIPYIVMEFVDGITLREMLNNGPRILPERGLEIVAGVLAALDYAHRHGIIHRDIKPANIMINAHGDAKVMDFGIARAVSDAATSVTATSAVMGTAQYLSPEQARGEVVDARSDIYSSGCVLYELLIGTPPFNGETPVSIAYQHVNEAPKAPSLLDPSIPLSLDAIVLHALAKHPSHRYQTAAEMRADVERAIAGMPISAPTPQPTAVTTVLDNTAAMPTIASPILMTQESGNEPQKKKRGRWFATAFAAISAAAILIFLGQQLFGSRPVIVSVPDLKGKTVAEATTSLTNVQLVLGQQDAQSDDNAAKGTIISQDPAPGENIEQGQAINITVSSGKEQTTVPDLIDLARVDDARIALTDARLVLGKQTEVDSDKPEGTIVSQSVSPNSSVDVGTRVDVEVSSGKVAVPDVVNKTKTQARNDLINAGFQVQITYEATDVEAPGTVLAQTPVAKTMVKKGTTVTITVAQALPTPSVTATPTASPTASSTTTP
jgi:serine/threonine-protein kinase